MQDEFEKWVTNNREDCNPHKVDNIFNEIAEKYGFNHIAKYTLISIFQNKYNEIIIAWHDDHDRGWSINEEGFDINSMDLTDYYWRQDIISDDEFRDIFSQLNDFSTIPEKLRNAVIDFLEHPELLDAKSYQNIYHNLFKKDAEKFEVISRKYHQKAQVIKFLNSYGFIQE